MHQSFEITETPSPTPSAWMGWIFVIIPLRIVFRTSTSSLDIASPRCFESSFRGVKTLIANIFLDTVNQGKTFANFCFSAFSLRNFIQDVHRCWLTWYVSWVHKLYPIIAVTLKICFLFCLICIGWLQCSLEVQVCVIVCAVFAPYVSYGSWCIHNPTDVESQCAEDKPSRERFLSLVAALVVCFGSFWRG